MNKKFIYLFFISIFLLSTLSCVLASDISSFTIISNYTKGELFNSFLAIVPNVLLISLIIPVLIYFKYGKQPKFDFNQEFDGKIPTDDSPIFIDAFYSTVTEVGDVSRYGVEATLMDLINRGYIKTDKNSKGDLLLVLNNKNFNLDDYEKGLIDALKVFEEKGKVSFCNKSKKTKEKFARKVNKFELDYQNKHKRDMDKLFKSKGNTYIKIYAGIIGFLAFIFFILADNSVSISAKDAYFISFTTLVICFLLFLFPNNIGGKWTKIGLKNFNQWKLFKNYVCNLDDISTPSLDVLKSYLIYSMAMGCSDNIIKKIHNLDNNDNLIEYCNFGGAKAFSDIMDSITTVNVNVIGSKGHKKR